MRTTEHPTCCTWAQAQRAGHRGPSRLPEQGAPAPAAPRPRLPCRLAQRCSRCPFWPLASGLWPPLSAVWAEGAAHPGGRALPPAPAPQLGRPRPPAQPPQEDSSGAGAEAGPARLAESTEEAKRRPTVGPRFLSPRRSRRPQPQGLPAAHLWAPQ